MLTLKLSRALSAGTILAFTAIAGACSDDDSLPENESPSVTIYSPENFRTFSMGDNVIIHAVANDPNGTVSRLEFYRNEIKIGEVDGRHPYEYTWASTDTGRYNITVIAIDNGGAQTTSPEVTIKIKENKLLDKQWQLVARTIQGNDAYSLMDPCEKDNFKEFNPDGTLSYDESLTKCSFDAAQTERGSWSYNLDHTAFSEIKNAAQIDYKIVTLNKTELKVTWSRTEGSNTYNYADTYVPR